MKSIFFKGREETAGWLMVVDSGDEEMSEVEGRAARRMYRWRNGKV